MTGLDSLVCPHCGECKDKRPATALAAGDISLCGNCLGVAHIVEQHGVLVLKPMPEYALTDADREEIGRLRSRLESVRNGVRFDLN